MVCTTSLQNPIASVFKTLTGDSILRLLLVTPDANGRAETEPRIARVAFVGVFVFGFGCFEHLVIGQSFGGGTLVTIHPVSLVVGDFLEFVAVLRKLVRQGIV